SEIGPRGKLRSAKIDAPMQDRGAIVPSASTQSVSVTDLNAPVAVSPIGGDVVAAVVRGGVGSAIGVRRSCRIRPVTVATAIVMAASVADVTVAGVAVGAVGRGASFDAANGLAAAIETVQSCSTIDTRCSTRDVTRRCARGAT